MENFARGFGQKELHPFKGNGTDSHLVQKFEREAALRGLWSREQQRQTEFSHVVFPGNEPVVDPADEPCVPVQK